MYGRKGHGDALTCFVLLRFALCEEEPRDSEPALLPRAALWPAPDDIGERS